MRNLTAILCSALALFASCHRMGEENSAAISNAEDIICDPLERKNLHRIAMGTRRYQNAGDSIWLGFKTYNYHFKNQDQARPFFIGIVQHILNGYNNNPTIRPILQRYPLQASDLWLKINFYKHAPNAHLPLTEIYKIELKNGTISYYKWDADTDELICIQSESYSDALEKSGK